MYVLAMSSLKEAMEYGSPFSFIITFANIRILVEWLIVSNFIVL